MAHVAIIETGLWDVPRNEIIQAETPEIYAKNLPYTISGYCVVVKDKKLGNILFDTGFANDWQTSWLEVFKKTYTIKSMVPLQEGLKKAGLSIDDIDVLICSHLHYDHVGNVKLFRNTKAGRQIIISRAEAAEAFIKTACSPSGISGAYCRKEFVMDGIGYKLLDEDAWISDDVHLCIQRGHTPGVIGLIVKTDENGYLFFPSDAIYSRKNYGPPVVYPGLCVDHDSYQANIERLRGLQDTYKARLFFSHEVDDFKTYNKAPQWYL